MDPDRTSASYDRIADSYERRCLEELAGKPLDRELLDGLATGNSGLVLDVGSGPGQVGAYVREHGRPVVGLDLSKVMASKASGRLDAAVVATMLALPLVTRRAPWRPRRRGAPRPAA